MPDIKKLISIIVKLEDEKEIEKFLKEILTPNEIKDLSLRWELMGMLKKGISQRNISSNLGISLCKITRGSKVLKNKESISNKILNDGELK